MPGCPPTLQNGTRTAACVSDGLCVFSESDCEKDALGASRMMLHARGVSGSVSEMSGFEDRLSEGAADDMKARSIESTTRRHRAHAEATTGV